MHARILKLSPYLLKTDSSNNTPHCIGQWGCVVNLRFNQRLTGWQGLHKTSLPHLFYGYSTYRQYGNFRTPSTKITTLLSSHSKLLTIGTGETSSRLPNESTFKFGYECIHKLASLQPMIISFRHLISLITRIIYGNGAEWGSASLPPAESFVMRADPIIQRLPESWRSRRCQRATHANAPLYVPCPQHVGDIRGMKEGRNNVPVHVPWKCSKRTSEQRELDCRGLVS